MANESVATQIGQAWRSHREGNNEAAIEQFGRILRTTPDSIDANYGLGLANRALGNHAAATEAFQRALDMTDRAEATSQEDRDRYMMLSRMTRQRLEEVKAATGAG
jgi:tetratricopeptide (TPR) repeat protein